MTTELQERDWIARLEQMGEDKVRSDLQLRHGVAIGFNHPDMHRVAEEWLRGKEKEREQRELTQEQREHQREHRERLTYAYVRWTFWAAIAAVVVGVATLIATVIFANR